MSAEPIPFVMPDHAGPSLAVGGNGADAPSEAQDISVQELLGVTLDMEASELHLTTGTPPVVRVHGDLKRLENYPPLTSEGLRRMVVAVLTQQQRGRFGQGLELDASSTL